ncbi:MAG: DUF1553 domain-containing protein, partial [Planctomycetota bacterium]
FPTQLTEKEFESARYDELDDMAATVGTAMLGLTIGCARCHDHKFDPIPVKDYYRFVSTFTTTIRSEIDVELNPSGYQAKLREWEKQHADVVADKENYENSPEMQQRFEAWLQATKPGTNPLDDWIVLETLDAKSTGKNTKLITQSDGAILASGKAANKETYTVQTSLPAGAIRHLRIEALTDDSMKRKGPGRASNGNFALSDFKVFVVQGKKRQSLSLHSPKATHQQNTGSLSVASSIDADTSGTGWAVDFGGIGKDQAAVFSLKDAVLESEEATLEFKLTFNNNSQHSLGSFRLSVSSLTEPPVKVGGGRSAELTDALNALHEGKLTEEHRRTLFPVFANSDAGWEQRVQAITESQSTKPAAEKVKVQVSSEGFPPTKHHADGRGFPHFYPETHFLSRGDPNQKNGVASQGFLQVLMREGADEKSWQLAAPADWTRTSFRRASLANWMTDAEGGAGHLLARVVVNRLWHHHFGRGIVATPNDFGLQGTPPTHPELLDYLAQKLIQNDWHIKSIHREILLSATWQQSSETDPEKMKLDPENQLFWRYPVRRLEAEVVRDSMLAASGQLDSKMFGSGTLNPNQRRRSIYFMIKRSRLIPMMQIFDQPEPLSSQGSRPSTTIAPQALMFMNNPQVVSWASGFAQNVDKFETEEAVAQIYLRALGRQPTQSELKQNSSFIEEQAASYGNPAAGRRQALADLCQVVFGLNEFIYLP